MSGDVIGEKPSKRVATDERPVEPEMIEKSENVGGVVFHCVTSIRLVTQPTSSQIHRDEPDLQTECLRQTIEAVGVGGQPVGHDENRAVAAMIDVVQPDSVGVDEFTNHVCSSGDNLRHIDLPEPGAPRALLKDSREKLNPISPA